MHKFKHVNREDFGGEVERVDPPKPEEVKQARSVVAAYALRNKLSHDETGDLIRMLGLDVVDEH